MTAPTTHSLDDRRVLVLDALARHLHDHGVDATARDTVHTLLHGTGPGSEARLAVRRGDTPVLVERLAAWALRRAPEDALDRAVDVLLGDHEPAEVSGDLVACC